MTLSVLVKSCFVLRGTDLLSSTTFRSTLAAYEFIISIVIWPTGPSLNQVDGPRADIVPSVEGIELVHAPHR